MNLHDSNLSLYFLFRLFQEERPVWHTIDCNALPKDYKVSKVKEEDEDTEIVMVTDSEINDSEQ